MAKAKKSETSEKPAAKKAPAKKVAAKKLETGSSASPMVDTTLAAQNVAKLFAAGLPQKAGSAGAAPKTESSMFKSLKQGLAKPHLSSLDSLLDKSAPADQKKSGVPFGANRQVGHNQTFGADVNRTGVPRRTGG